LLHRGAGWVAAWSTPALLPEGLVVTIRRLAPLSAALVQPPLSHVGARSGPQREHRAHEALGSRYLLRADFPLRPRAVTFALHGTGRLLALISPSLEFGGGQVGVPSCSARRRVRRVVRPLAADISLGSISDFVGFFSAVVTAGMC